MEKILTSDDQVSNDGRVMEVLSEHRYQGWLEVYLRTGRHGFFTFHPYFTVGTGMVDDA